MKPLSIVTILGNNGGARLLEVCGPARCPNMRLLTPSVMLYTKGACVPHLTHEVFEMVTKDDFIFQTPLLNTVQMKKGAETLGKGLAHFSGLGDSPIFMTFQDPIVEIPQTQFEKFYMPLWARMGKKFFDADMYMDYVEAFKPDIYLVLTDGCTDVNSAKKRVSKAVDRSKHMLSRCLERHTTSEYLSKNSSILGAIQGGFCLTQRKDSLENVLGKSDSLDGFILDGFDCNGPNVENIPYDSIKEVVEFVTSKLPNDKLRIIQGCWNAVTLIDLVMAGWDLFDSSMPFMVTERGCALTLNILNESSQAPVDFLDTYEINLNEEKYVEDFNPILKDCKCLTCTKHTRAYINHLLNTKELLGGVLLSIHNLHHYLEFFSIIRKSISTGTTYEIRSKIAKQYENHPKKDSDIKDENLLNNKKKRL